MKYAWSAFFGCYLASAMFAQQRLDDKPTVLDTTPRTKEELQRYKADQLLRDARTKYGMAIMFRRHDQVLDAVRTLEQAQKLDPESIVIRKSLVPMYALLGREPEAMTQCQAILDADPCDADTAFQYARFLKADGQPNTAIPVLQKAIAGKDAQSKPERLLFMLSDLYDFLQAKEEYNAAADVQDQLIQTIITHKETLLFGNGITRDDLQGSLAKAHERLGQCRVKTKQYAQALQAFRNARDTMLKLDDPDARRQAHRINWNISEMAYAQEKWTEANTALDLYLELRPSDLQPYERKLDLLKKLGRERDVVPLLKKYADADDYHVGLKLMLAREMTKNPRLRADALTIYEQLLVLYIKPEIYSGLFKLHQANDQMVRVLDRVDEAVKLANSKPGEVKADIREAAQERLRAMLHVLRTDVTLVSALLPVALEELPKGDKRELDTMSFLAALAAKARQLDKAETLFRQCLINAPADQEFKVYSGLLQVLALAKKFDKMADLCRDVLSGKKPARNTNALLFEANLATALAELGQLDDAIVHAEKAVKLASDDTKVRQRCRKAEILTKGERFDDAILECEATLKEFTKPANVREIRYTLSNIYTAKGDHAKSEAQLRLILETDPESPLANNNLGYQLADRNEKLDEAEKMIRTAISNDRLLRRDTGEDEENAAYLDSLGWVLFRKGQTTEARDWLEKAAALSDGADDPTVWDHLGDVYAKLNDMTKAKEAWHKAKKLYEGSRTSKKDNRRAALEQKLKVIE